MGILTNNIAHSGIVDLLQSAYLLDGLDKGGGIATHVAHHDLDARLVTRFDDGLRLLACQTHGFLNQNMFAMLKSSEGRVGMIFIAIQDQDRVQVSLGSDVMIVRVTALGGNVITLPQRSQQFL